MSEDCSLEKRYQVFISSTFQDLQNARQEVSQALLRADCFPAGMELFPAADEEQFEFIKTVIDQSDYYIIISAGRYGSIHPETGLSYTEMEYDYAVETGKPVIRLLHKDPFNELKGEFIEKTDEGREKLNRFREKLMDGKLVNFWQAPEQLGQLVVFGLMDSRKRKPAIGWVQGSAAVSQEMMSENINLREEILDLKSKLLEQSAHGGSRHVALLKLFDGDVELTEKLVRELSGTLKPSKRASRHSLIDHWLTQFLTNLGMPDQVESVFDALIYDGLLVLDREGFYEVSMLSRQTAAWAAIGDGSH